MPFAIGYKWSPLFFFFINNGLSFGHYLAGRQRCGLEWNELASIESHIKNIRVV